MAKEQKQCEQLSQEGLKFPDIDILHTLGRRWYLVITKYTFQSGLYQTPWHSFGVTNVNFPCTAKCIESDWAVTESSQLLSNLSCNAGMLQNAVKLYYKIYRGYIYLCADRNCAGFFFSNAPHYWWGIIPEKFQHTPSAEQLYIILGPELFTVSSNRAKFSWFKFAYMPIPLCKGIGYNDILCFKSSWSLVYWPCLKLFKANEICGNS